MYMDKAIPFLAGMALTILFVGVVLNGRDSTDGVVFWQGGIEIRT
ncbi:MAG: hypothetical protein R3236_04165 [Phycisphaeraceae bacterium]|nr:hypothetical protein [Phycisphaeraceae bacterium]